VKLAAPGGSRIFFYRIESAVFNMLLIESDWFAFRETPSSLLTRTGIERAPGLPGGQDALQPEAHMLSLRGSK